MHEFILMPFGSRLLVYRTLDLCRALPKTALTLQVDPVPQPRLQGVEVEASHHLVKEEPLHRGFPPPGNKEEVLEEQAKEEVREDCLPRDLADLQAKGPPPSLVGTTQQGAAIQATSGQLILTLLPGTLLTG